MKVVVVVVVLALPSLCLNHDVVDVFDFDMYREVIPKHGGKICLE